MATEIIRVSASPGRTWAGWAWDVAKDRPYLALAAAPVAVVAAPMIATTTATVGTAALGATATIAALEFWRGSGETVPVKTYTPEQAKGMFDVDHQPLSCGVVYLRHPKHIRSSTIVKSSDFHSYIMAEKVSEIIHYLRSETDLLSLDVFVRSSDSKYVVVGGRLENIDLQTKADASKNHTRRMNLTYQDPTRINHRHTYVWIDEFPEIITATRDARRGTMSFSQATDMSFGLSGSAAKIAKFESGWLSSFIIEIKASFA